MSRFTLEHALWLGTLALAAALRLAHLDLPLDNREALGALAAYAHANGERAVLLAPLHDALQAALFGILGASDALARLPSAAVGMLLVALPWRWRDQMGRWRAWCMSALLAISPTLWFASRVADGGLLAWTLALATWTLARPDGDHRRLVIVAGLFGALLACGRAAPFPLLGLLAALVLERRLVALLRERRFWMVAGLSLLLSSTLGLWRWQGLGDAFEGYAAWVAGWSTEATLSALRLAVGFLLAEPLLLVLALAGVGLARSKVSAEAERSWLVWIGVGALAAVAYPDRSATLLAPVAVGLARWGSWALAHWIRTSASREAVSLGAAAVAGAGFGFAAVSTLQLAGSGRAEWLLALPMALAVALLVLLLGSLREQFQPALRGVMLAGLALLGVYTLGVGARLSWWGTDNPAEPYRAEVTAPGLTALRDTLDDLSARALGERRALRVQLAEPAPPALRWQLRERLASDWSPAPTDRALLLPPGAAPRAGAWAGHTFEVRATQPLGHLRCDLATGRLLDCQPLARWVAWRQVDEGAQRARWTLWMPQDMLARAVGRQ